MPGTQIKRLLLEAPTAAFGRRWGGCPCIIQEAPGLQTANSVGFFFPGGSFVSVTVVGDFSVAYVDWDGFGWHL